MSEVFHMHHGSPAWRMPEVLCAMRTALLELFVVPHVLIESQARLLLDLWRCALLCFAGEEAKIQRGSIGTQSPALRKHSSTPREALLAQLQPIPGW